MDIAFLSLAIFLASDFLTLQTVNMCNISKYIQTKKTGSVATHKFIFIFVCRDTRTPGKARPKEPLLLQHEIVPLSLCTEPSLTEGPWMTVSGRVWLPQELYINQGARGLRSPQEGDERGRKLTLARRRAAMRLSSVTHTVLNLCILTAKQSSLHFFKLVSLLFMMKPGTQMNVLKTSCYQVKSALFLQIKIVSKQLLLQ